MTLIVKGSWRIPHNVVRDIVPVRVNVRSPHFVSKNNNSFKSYSRASFLEYSQLNIQRRYKHSLFTHSVDRKTIPPAINPNLTIPKIDLFKIKANNFESLFFKESYHASLSLEIQKEYNKLVRLALGFDEQTRNEKKINGTGGLVSVADIIAYQIGWGKLVLKWYAAGIDGKTPEMPGDGFNSWDYTGLARHFYKNYQYENSSQQMQEFHHIVKQILEIVEKEHKTGNLVKEGVWPWCTIKSGKTWPLSKWITVNTSSPYKKASNLIRLYSN